MRFIIQAMKLIFIIVYLVPASVLGTAILYGMISSYFPHNEISEDKHIIEPLPNGFIYDHGQTPHESAIKDVQGNIVVYPTIDKLKWKGKTIYGKRHGLSEHEEYYFVCDYGDDCLEKQNYMYGDFFKILQQRQLPGFEEITKFE